MGISLLDGASIDAICETIRDFKDNYQKVRSSSPELKDKALQEYFSDTLPCQLSKLNNVIKSKQQVSQFVIGKNLSLADITIFLFLTDFFDEKEMVLKAYEKLDSLKSIVDNVGNLDSVKNWLKNRPQTQF